MQGKNQASGAACPVPVKHCWQRGPPLTAPLHGGPAHALHHVAVLLQLRRGQQHPTADHLQPVQQPLQASSAVRAPALQQLAEQLQWRQGRQQVDRHVEQAADEHPQERQQGRRSDAGDLHHHDGRSWGAGAALLWLWCRRRSWRRWWNA